MISKCRGSEKNAHMNNYGIALAVLGLVFYTVGFADWISFLFCDKKHQIWFDNHEKPYWFIWWTGNTCYLLFHWLFNWRYVKSTFRLPVLQEIAVFHNEMLKRIVMQREDQNVLITSEELKKHTDKISVLKKRQAVQEKWSKIIEICFFILLAVSSYFYVFKSSNKTETYFYVPTFLLLNLIMLVAVILMRFMIKKMPNLFPKENLVIVHVLLFTAVTSLWILTRIYHAAVIRSINTYNEYASD